MRVSASSSAVVGCALVLCCTPAEPKGSPPKNGQVTSNQLGSGDGDADDTAGADDDSTALTVSAKECRDACREAQPTAVAARKAYDRCFRLCSEDDVDCVSDCESELSSACVGTRKACKALDACLSSCD